jgi:hypothetical protein
MKKMKDMVLSVYDFFLLRITYFISFFIILYFLGLVIPFQIEILFVIFGLTIIYVSVALSLFSYFKENKKIEIQFLILKYLKIIFRVLGIIAAIIFFSHLLLVFFGINSTENLSEIIEKLEIMIGQFLLGLFLRFFIFFFLIFIVIYIFNILFSVLKLEKKPNFLLVRYMSTLFFSIFFVFIYGFCFLENELIDTIIKEIYYRGEVLFKISLGFLYLKLIKKEFRSFASKKKIIEKA